LKRGDIWTVSDRGFAGKPRPAAIVQSDFFNGGLSITICPFTSDPTEAPLFRLTVTPDGDNGLATSSKLMVDKLSTVFRDKLGQRIGRLGDADLLRLNRAMAVFLGLSG
jgi:mRNA interferase MazF